MQVTIRGEALREQSFTTFCMLGDMLDVIICAEFEVKIFLGVWDICGVKFWVLPVKWLVTLTTVLCCSAACDVGQRLLGSHFTIMCG